MSLPTNPTLKKTPSSTVGGATDSPYLGSKISLVSKAKIRYEGILYTIDANESTVALSKVRSFGTEDRPTDRPVHARDEIFEYIIFRGADIEDLQVREPPQSSFTHDPAIVESSMYPANARSNTVGNNNLGGSSQSGQTRSSSNQGTMPSPPTQQGSSKGHKLSSNNDPLRQLNMNQQQSSRPYSQQSPAAQLDGQDFSYGNGSQRRGRQQQQQQRQDYYDEFSGNGTARRNNQNYGYAEWPRVNSGGAGWDASWGNGYRQQQQQQQQQQRYSSRGQQNFYPQRRFNNGQQQSNGYYGNERGYGYRQRRNSTGGITGTDSQEGTQQQQRGNRQQQHQQQNQQQRERANSTRGNGNTSRTALKFIGDFDFEKSNAEFDKNAIEDEIKKSLSIKTTKGETTSDDTPKSPNKTDGNTPATQQEKENQQSQQQLPISSSSQSEQELNPDGYYDKQKSFFDRISCEATEKERTNARRNWNEERRMNAETFGLKYRPVQQGGNQRGGQGGYYNNNRRNNNVNNGGNQQMYYGNGGRYPRGGGGGYGGQQQQQQQQQQRGRGNGQSYGRNTMYYGNSTNRMRAY